MRPQKGFFFLCWNQFSWRSINCLHSFLMHSDRESSFIAEWRAKAYKNNLKICMTTGFLIISLWWRITLLKQRGLCELSEIAKTLSIVYVKVFRLFICLYENTGAVDVELPRSRNSKKWKISHWTREKSFLWMEAVFGNEFCKLQIYLSFSCYRIEIRTSKNSDKLWAYWVSLTVSK